jgi:hypothetical protein
LKVRDIEELKELLMELNEEKREEFQAEIPYVRSADRWCHD